MDGLRAVSVIMVVLFHMNPSWCPGGFIGVDLFFVISGFVVTKSLLDRQSDGVVEFVVGFLARRAKRLLPASLIVISLAAPALGATAPHHLNSQVATCLKVAMAGVVGNANNWLYPQFPGVRRSMPVCLGACWFGKNRGSTSRPTATWIPRRRVRTNPTPSCIFGR